jgi:hypothetical protein
MSTVSHAAAPAHAMPGALRFAPSLYAVGLFVSAFLLFAVQPMFTKMVLPLLGGAPSVWSVAMVFFQAALLCGYAYAHFIVRRMPFGTGALAHLGLLAVAAATLPIAVTQNLGSPPTDNIPIWLVGILTLSIGLPFAVLSTSAPLLQSWFAASGHSQASNPYVLYAASNLGSFAGLLSYPILVEPFLTLHEQAELWSTGFGVFAVLAAAAAVIVARRENPFVVSPAKTSVRWRDRLVWVAVASIPAGLVIAVTSYIATDLASAPFLWVLPLAIYLLTFVATFRDRPLLDNATVARLVPFAVAPLSIGLLGAPRSYWFALVILNLLAFVLLSLLCNGKLYKQRPAPEHLTEFYLWTSVGGALGGAFAALAAPHLFPQVYEYPILIVAALLVMPDVFAPGLSLAITEGGPALLMVLLAIVARFAFSFSLPTSAELPFQIVLVALVALMLLQRDRPARFAALAVLGFVVTGLWQPGFNRVAVVRSFFGVNQVVETADSNYRLLYHGTTLHGAERISDTAATRPEPLSYYYRGGPLSDGIEAVRAVRGGLRNVAVVGLGTGALVCYRQTGEQWTFYEIDAAVAQIARDPRFFSFISGCAPDLPIVIGDARLTLTASKRRYDLIILDAFSSDAIPVHLMTREAIGGYLNLLGDDGVILMQISNRYMELADTVAAIGAAEGLVALIRQDDRPEAKPFDYKLNAEVVALARRPEDFGELQTQKRWHELKAESGARPWTDDYSNLLGAILRKQREKWEPPDWAAR